MSDWGGGGGGVITTAGITAATSRAATMTAGQNTKGSWAELISAANNRDAEINGFLLLLEGRGNSSQNYAVDIGVGAASSEQVILPDLSYFCKNIVGSWFAYIPLRIPGGTRISARCASAGTFDVDVQIVGFNSAFSSLPVFGSVDSMGISSTNGNGVDLDPGGTLNTKGAYAQIIASTAHHYKAIVVCLGNSDNTSASTNDNLVDIAIGAASSEVIVVADFAHLLGAQEMAIPNFIFLNVDIPQGVRLSARKQSSEDDATDRLSDIGILGFY